MDIDYQGGGGYAVVRRAMPIEYPENYEIAFWVRGTVPPNNLEFKLVDASGDNVWWVNRRDFRFGPEWTQVVIKARHVEFAWGPTADKTLRRTPAQFAERYSAPAAADAGDGGGHDARPGRDAHPARLGGPGRHLDWGRRPCGSVI